MSYSCTDFADDVLSYLRIHVPDEATDDPQRQSQLAISKIQRMETALADAAAMLEEERGAGAKELVKRIYGLLQNYSTVPAGHYQFTATLNVTDEEAVLCAGEAAAREKGMAFGGGVTDALYLLLDKGRITPPGCEVVDTLAEEF